MIGPCSVAAAQTTPVRGDVPQNTAQHLRLARIAAEARARVLLFPELSLTGYEMDLAAGLAFEERDPRLAPLLEAASSSSMTLVVGAPVRIGGRLHIGAFIISPDGRVDVYTKRHLGAFPAGVNPGGSVPPAEATVFHPGDLDPLVRFGRLTAAVAVCADAGRPSHAREAAGRNADVYLASMFLIPPDLERETGQLRTYAERHSMAVVLANYGGPSGGLASGGASAIWSDRGTLLGRLPAAGAGVITASLDRGRWSSAAVMADEFGSS